MITEKVKEERDNSEKMYMYFKLFSSPISEGIGPVNWFFISSLKKKKKNYRFINQLTKKKKLIKKFKKEKKKNRKIIMRKCTGVLNL